MTKETIKIRFEWKGESLELAAVVARVDSPDLLMDQIAAYFIDVAPETNETLNRLVDDMLDATSQDGGDDDDVIVVEVED